jgi:hypothetical protein
MVRYGVRYEERRCGMKDEEVSGADNIEGKEQEDVHEHCLGEIITVSSCCPSGTTNNVG